MTHLLAEAFRKAQDLPEPLQDELAEQLIEDVESELKWQQALAEPQPARLDELAVQALKDAVDGKTHKMGFDEL
jgi:hypothetical protein